MISVVIPTYDRPDLLKETLSSLAKCKIPATYRELVVIENGMKTGAEILVAQLPEKLNARYMFVKQGNKSNALNEAIASVDGGVVIFTDDDARFSSGFITAYAEASAKYKEGVYFGGPVMIDKDDPFPDWMEPLLPHSARGYDLVNERMNNSYLGINWAAFASDIKKLGGFDIRFGPGSSTGATGQETDMQRRMKQAGMKQIDVLDAVVWHRVTKASYKEEWLVNRYFKYGISKGVKKHTLKDMLLEFFNAGKYMVRWMVYLILLNKMERKKSKMEIVTRLGYFYFILKKSN